MAKYVRDTPRRYPNEEVSTTAEDIEELARCFADKIHFFSHWCWITSKDAEEGLTKFEPRDFQIKIVRAIDQPPNGKKHAVIKVARQSGKTTLVAAYILHYILFSRKKLVAVMAHTQEQAIEILNTIKDMFDRLPRWMQQGVVVWNAKSIRLENGCRVVAGSTSGESITGKAVNLLILDEFGKVANHVAEAFIRSSFPTISSGKTTKLIILSTPKGMNHFYDIWQKSLDEDSPIYRMSFPYWVVPGRDEAWKREQISQIGVVGFKQEYECEFLGSASTMIEGSILSKLVAKDPVKLNWNGALQIYELPKKRTTYFAGSDISKGVGSDYSTIQIFKLTSAHTAEQVAVFRANTIQPKKFTPLLYQVLEYFNSAWVLIETNDNGVLVANKLQELGYDNMVYVTPGQCGIQANKYNKSEAIVTAKELIENQMVTICDAETIAELSRFEEVSPGVFKASSGHDDLVTALLWSQYIRVTNYWDDILDHAGFSIVTEEEAPISYMNIDNFEALGDDDDYYSRYQTDPDDDDMDDDLLTPGDQWSNARDVSEEARRYEELFNQYGDGTIELRLTSDFVNRVTISQGR